MTSNQIELPQLGLTLNENTLSLQQIEQPVIPIICTKQCRICLQNQSQTKNIELIQPCICSGTLQYVHEECLEKWIQISLSNKQQQQQIENAKQFGLKCQICKTHIKFTIITQYTLAQFQTIKERFANKIVYNSFLLLMFLIICAGVGFISWFLTIETNPFSLVYVYSLVGLVFLCLMLCPIVYFLMFRILIVKKQKIITNKSKNEQGSLSHKVASINNEDVASYQSINSTLRGVMAS